MKVKVTSKGSQVGKGGLPPLSYFWKNRLANERGQATLPNLLLFPGFSLLSRRRLSAMGKDEG